MTDQERADIMQREAMAFIEAADKKYNGTGITNEQMAAELFGVIGGAVACLRASDLPWNNILAGINSMIEDMRG
jgi:hypothetical protein